MPVPVLASAARPPIRLLAACAATLALLAACQGAAPPQAARPAAAASPAPAAQPAGAALVDAPVASVLPEYDGRPLRAARAAIDATYQALWDKGAGTGVAALRTETFPGFPFLVLEDRDRDGTPEFYSYNTAPKIGPTQEFGWFGDLSGDGRPDWIVFYGGSLMDENKRLLWWSRHIADRNHDGRFDTMAFDRVDMDRDGLVEAGDTVWIFDADFDGRIDAVEHVIGGVPRPAPMKGGRFDLRIGPATEGPKPGDPIGGVFDRIAADIAAAM
ncbi:hypothetical protein ACQ5SO_13590 [Rhodovulum sp. DZ06]|uniref:hypothetical protein n=1 Tax=Rhodovulum sp. DZ06 TaxID=3425126 RepID=UPI003D345C50